MNYGKKSSNYKMSQEIERKFLVKALPENLDTLSFEKIMQGYLAIDNDELEVRFRKKGDKYFQTIKQGNGLNREEIEIQLTKEQFVNFWPLTEGRRIIKRRYEIPYQEYTVELDIYEDRFNGMVACEVEFGSEVEAYSFEPPDWFGSEVTEEYSLQNNRLAMYGIDEKITQKYDINLREENMFLQSGCIPVRKAKNWQVLIITSSSKKSWIFPKGIIEHGLTSEESALKEAYEEAGILGVIGEKIDSYSYKKWNGTCRVEMFTMENVKELNQWPEDYRHRKWVSIENLSKYIKKQELQNILQLLKQKYK